MACLFGHKWNGCTCARCGKTRDEAHDWNGCTCRICGKRRAEGHDWHAPEGKCATVCSICGAQGRAEHQFVGSVCTKCGYDSGMPAMDDWFRKYEGTAEVVTIPEGFKCMSAEAFRKNTFVKKVVLPSTMTEIKRMAFSQCSNLREVVLPPGMRVLGPDIFYACGNLGPVWLPAGIRMENDTFDEGQQLTGPGAPRPEDKITPFIKETAARIDALEGPAQEECLAILLAIYARPDGDFSNRSEDNKLVRRVGEYLDAQGGMRAMRGVGEQFARQNPARARLLETTWDGIGMWMG